MKAIVNNIPAFDATIGTSGSFVTNTPITGFDIIITDKETGSLAYSDEIRKSTNKFTILQDSLGNKLENNKTYLLKIKTYELDGGEFESDPVIIMCISSPTFKIVLNDEVFESGEFKLRSSILDVGVEYSHASEDLDYYYVVLEQAFSIPQKSKYVYDKAKHIKLNDLKDDTTYRITVCGQTVNGMTITSSTITINSKFAKNETFVMMKANNNHKNACVDINTSIKNVLYRADKEIEMHGEISGSLKRTAVNLSDNVLEYYDGFTLYNTFSLFLEYYPASSKERVLNLNDGEIVLVYGLEDSKPYFEFRYNGKILLIKKDREGKDLSTRDFYIIIYRNDIGEIKIDIRNK